MAGFEKPVAFRDFFESQDAAHVGLQLAFVHKFGGPTQNISMTFGSDAIDAGRAHELENQCRAKAKKLLRNFIGRRADAGDEPAIGGKAVQRAIECFAPDRIKYHRTTAPGSFLFYAFREV